MFAHSSPSLAGKPLAERLHLLASTRPDDIAVIDGNETCSFGELVDRASALAAAIVDRQPGGTGPLLVVGDRGLALLVSVAATLLAGRGFVIVETDQGSGRIRDIADVIDAGLVVLAEARLEPLLRPGTSWVALDRTGAPPQGALPARDPADIGCVIFTSGSTGRPKGAMMRHDTLEARADRRMFADYVLPDEDVVAATEPLSFAAGLQRLYDLVAGRTIDMFDASQASPLELAEWLDSRGVVHLSLVPSLVRSIVQVWPRGRRMEAVRRISTVGEPLYWSDVADMRRLGAPGMEVEALYGSTEAAMILRYLIGPEHPIGRGLVPLGLPCDGREVRLEPVEAIEGAPTEIVLYGGRMFDGYWRDPELTAERFHVTPEGVRVYRTGDLAVRRPDGVFESIGRVDDLVKIRGFLVEPAEAERVLRGIPGVRSASVLSHAAAEGHRLVAHVVLERDTDLAPVQVRRQMLDSLPPHLVPPVFVRHDELPITERGKVDRDALRAAPLDPWRDADPLPDRDVFERAVISETALLLELPVVSRDDDLLDLGADSLMLQELAVRLSDRFGTEVSIATVVANPNLERLAAAIRRSGGQESSDGIVVLNDGGARRPLVAMAGAAGTAAAFHPLAEGLGPEQPVWVVHQRGLLRPGRWERSIEEWAANARDALADRGLQPPYLLAGHSIGALVAYEVARQLHADGSEVCLLALLDPPPPRCGPKADAARPLRVRSTPVDDRLSSRLSWLVRGAKNRSARPVRRLMLSRRAPRTIEEFQIAYEAAMRASEGYEAPPFGLDADIVLLHVGAPTTADLWREVADVDVLPVAGDHLSMLETRCVGGVVEVLRARLDAAHRSATC